MSAAAASVVVSAAGALSAKVIPAGEQLLNPNQQQQQQQHSNQINLPASNGSHLQSSSSQQIKMQAEQQQQQQQPAVTVARKRGRRRQQTIPDQPNGLDRVFVWDIDGSLVRSDTIADSGDLLEPSVLASVTDKLGTLAKRLKELTLSFCEEHLFLGELESSDQMHIDDVHGGDAQQAEAAKRTEASQQQQQPKEQPQVYRHQEQLAEQVQPDPQTQQQHDQQRSHQQQELHLQQQQQQLHEHQHHLQLEHNQAGQLPLVGYPPQSLHEPATVMDGYGTYNLQSEESFHQLAAASTPESGYATAEVIWPDQQQLSSHGGGGHLQMAPVSTAAAIYNNQQHYDPAHHHDQHQLHNHHQHGTQQSQIQPEPFHDIHSLQPAQVHSSITHLCPQHNQIDLSSQQQPAALHLSSSSSAMEVSLHQQHLHHLQPHHHQNGHLNNHLHDNHHHQQQEEQEEQQQQQQQQQQIQRQQLHHHHHHHNHHHHQLSHNQIGHHALGYPHGLHEPTQVVDAYGAYSLQPDDTFHQLAATTNTPESGYAAADALWPDQQQQQPSHGVGHHLQMAVAVGPSSGGYNGLSHYNPIHHHDQHHHQHHHQHHSQHIAHPQHPQIQPETYNEVHNLQPAQIQHSISHQCNPQQNHHQIELPSTQQSTATHLSNSSLTELSLHQQHSSHLDSHRQLNNHLSHHHDNQQQQQHHHHHHHDPQQEQQLRQPQPQPQPQQQQQQQTKQDSNPATTLRTVLNNHHKQLSHRLSVRFHRIKTVYNSNRLNLNIKQEVDSDQVNQNISNGNNNNCQIMGSDLLEVLAEIDHYTLDWRKHAMDCLRLISESPNCTNIIVTKLPLVIALGHLVCLGLGQFFQVDQVYSASKSNKEACIKRIKKRFGATNRCSYIIVGDREDVDMAKRLDLPSWPTSRSDGHRQLLQLYTALKEGYLV